MHRRVRISGVELCDDRHTLLPFFFIALLSVLNPLHRSFRLKVASHHLRRRLRARR
jgi:hypothetical protein